MEFLDARDVVVTDLTYNDAAVDFAATTAKMTEHFRTHTALQCITGFIASSPCGETTCLGRGVCRGPRRRAAGKWLQEKGGC